VTVATGPAEVATVAGMAATVGLVVAVTVAATTVADPAATEDRVAADTIAAGLVVTEDREAAVTTAEVLQGKAARQDKAAATATEGRHTIHARDNLHRKEAVINDIPEKS